MLGLVFSSTGYAPAGRPTQSPTTPQRAAVSTNIRMNVAGGEKLTAQTLSKPPRVWLLTQACNP
tara:strand:+ start:105 stop:296 length:192 start_codon:yes stop_codon:yes gene_type:complete